MNTVEWDVQSQVTHISIANADASSSCTFTYTFIGMRKIEDPLFGNGLMTGDFYPFQQYYSNNRMMGG